MAIVADIPRDAYTATAGQTTFPYTFPIAIATELQVYKNGQLLTLSTHYNVTGIGTSSGNVVLTTGAALGDLVVILGVVALAQGVNLLPNDPFPAAVINGGLDHPMRAIQQMQEQFGRVPMLHPGGAARNLRLAQPVGTHFLRYSADGQTIENTALEIPAISTTFPVSVIDANAYGLRGDDSYDNAGLLTALIAACPNGGKIQLGPGRYRYTGTLTINKAITIEGTNRLFTALVPMTPNAPGVHISSGWVNLRDLIVDRVIKPTVGGDGIIFDPNCSNAHLQRVHVMKQYRGIVLAPVDIARLDALTIQNCESHGIDCDYDTNGAVQWYLTQCLSQSNLGDGFHCVNTSAVTGIGPLFLDCHSFNNTTGYYFEGESGHTLNDIWMLRCASSSEALGGIHLHNTFGELSMIQNCWVELIGMVGDLPRGFDGGTQAATLQGHGIHLSGNQGGLGAVNLVGGLVWACAWSGVAVEYANAHVTGITCINNGQALEANVEQRAGVLAKSASVAIDSCSLLKTVGNDGQLSGIAGSGAVSTFYVGSSNLFNGYTIDAQVDTSAATLISMARFPLGLAVNTARMGFQLTDEAEGPTPTKTLRVVEGKLQFLNAAAALIAELTDDGLLTAEALGVGNAAAATTIASPGTVAAKIEVFDRDGVSLGFIPVYAAIT